LEDNKKSSKDYINELEGKIVDLSLRLKSKKNELNTAKESNKKIIGKLVHNLKNPIGVVYSFSDMILEDIEDYSREKLEKHVQVMHTSAKFSIQLLNAIATYSQLQSQSLGNTRTSRNYIDLVQNVLNEFNVIAIEKNIKIEQNFPATPIILTLVEAEISLAIKNIMNNAFRYSNENSTIKIEIKDNKDSIETIIIDEGIGISEENLPLIMNEFFVVNTYSRDKQKCIGLGLAITNKIIKNHHGKISIVSNLNIGTNVSFSLPK